MQQPPPFAQPPLPSAPAKKPKAPWYRRWWAIALYVIIGLGVLNNLASGGDDTPTTAAPATTATVTVAPSPAETATASAAPPKSTEPVAPPATQAAERVPAESKAALRKAENYLDFKAFSKAGLFKQLTSEYGEKFSAEAAQYAVDNVKVDWNEQALKAAITYRDMMAMSNNAIWDQLVSEYGEQFTPEQADYAIANLPA